MKRTSLIFFIAACFSFSVYSSDVEISKVLKTYRENPARFHNDYFQKQIIAVGTISSIVAEDPLDRKTSRALGNPPVYGVSVDFKGGNVLCFIYRTETVAQLDKGQTVRIQGKVGDVNSTGTSFSVEDCSIETVKR